MREVSLLTLNLVFYPLFELIAQVLIKDHIQHFDVFKWVKCRVLKDQDLIDERLMEPG